MSQCTPRYLNTCSVPAIISRDGYAGANAAEMVPFVGLYFFSGAKYSFPQAKLKDAKSRTLGVIRNTPVIGAGVFCG